MPAEPGTARTPLADATWWLAGVLAFWSCGYAARRADDLWWHLAAGRRMLAERTLTRTDPFSFTAAGEPWLNDAWLADVVFAAWERAFGTSALVWWKWALVVTTFVVLMATLRRVAAGAADTAAAVAAWAGATLAAVTAAPFLDMRPQLYSLLGIALVLNGCVARATPAWWLPLVFALWANLHAGFIFGLACLWVAAVPALWAGGAPRRQALAIGLLAPAASLANPWGPIALTRPLRYAFDRSSPFHALAEWWPPFRPGGVESAVYPYLLALFVLASAVVLLRAELRRRPATWVGLGLGVATLVMSLTSRRFVPVFAIVQSLTLVAAGAPLLAPLVRRLPALVPALAALGLGLLWLAPYPRAGWAFHYLTAEDHFPVETATFLETNALTGNVFAQYAWAGYVVLRTNGRMKVFIDGRADALYPDELFRQYERASQGQPGWIEVIEGSDAEWVLWPRHLPWGALPGALRTTGRWQEVHRDAVAVLLRRADAAPSGSYQPTPPSAFRSYGRGVLAFDAGRLEEARREFTEALATAPHLRHACSALAMTEARSGNVDAGRAVLARCQRTFPLPGRVAWFEAQVEALDTVTQR